MMTMKKDFQKLMKQIRTEMGQKEFPKPMMTQVQMDKRQATVNCGGEWSTEERTKEMADAVLANKEFEEFLNKYTATAHLEMNNFGTYQIRICY